MWILHFYRVGLPNANADAIQVVNTCAGLSRAGAQVLMHVETQRASSVTECLDYFGIDDPSRDSGGSLDIRPVGRHWSWPFLQLKTRRSLKEPAGAPGILFVREVRPYVPDLMRRAKAAGLKIIFEAHNVSASLVKEKKEKASGDAATPAAPSPAVPTPPDLPPNMDLTPATPRKETETPDLKRLREKLEKREALEEEIIRGADGLVCTQRATLDGLQHLLAPGTPAIVLGNATQIPPARQSMKKDIDILYCGSLKQWKGVDLLVAAMQTLYPYRLTIAGPATDDDVERIQQAALAMGSFERLAILPAVSPREVWDLYARAKVGVIPLPGSGFVEARDFTSPLKLFEMMIAGLPIVASRLNSIQEYVEHNKEAVLVDVGNPKDLSAGLKRLLENDELRQQIAVAAKARAASHTWDERGRQLHAFAAQLVG